MQPELSLVVVTCDRPKRLRRLLERIGRQGLAADRFELLLSDDGSELPAESVLHDFEPSFQVRLVRGPRSGPATARNRVLHLARAPLLLFLNDDTVPAADLLETHLALQRKLEASPTAVLGTFRFTPELRRDLLLQVAEDLGLLQSAALEPGVPLKPLCFCTGNLSVPTAEVLEVGGFDESFPEPACEDLDLGYRLAQQRGVPLIFAGEAISWHDHPHSAEQWWERCRSAGRGFRRLAEKHGAGIFWPGGELLRSSPGLQERSRARLAVQEPLVRECVRWVERLENAAFEPGGPVWAFGRRFHLPLEAEGLMRISLALASSHVVQKSFWEAEAPWKLRAS